MMDRRWTECRHEVDSRQSEGGQDVGRRWTGDEQEVERRTGDRYDVDMR